MHTQRLILLTAVSVLAACAAPPVPAPAPPPPPMAPPAPPPEPEPPPPPPQVTEGTKLQAQKLALSAVDLLQQGDEDGAKGILQQALVNEPNNKLALNLMRQITADPASLLGHDSIAYTVRPGESLSILSKRYYNDVYLFYALARYNNIKVPRLVAGGQVIRIPGKGVPVQPVTPTTPQPTPPPPPPPPSTPTPPPPPPPVPPPAPAPAPSATEPTPSEKAFRSAEAAERAGNLPLALSEFRRAASFGHPAGDSRAEAVRKQLVARYTKSARLAFAKQDLPGAIENWDKVLELDPGNSTATLERQRSIDLQKRLTGIGK